MLAEYVEVESGKRDDRPELSKALHHAKMTSAVLLIARRFSFESARRGREICGVRLPRC